MNILTKYCYFLVSVWFLFFVLVSCSLSAYQPKECLTDKVSFIEYEKKGNGVDSKVVRLQGLQQFGERVMKSNVPMIVRVWEPKGIVTQKDQMIYQSVADQYRDLVTFFSLQVSENEDVIQFLMQKLKLEKIALPFFIFFKDGALLMPLTSDVDSKESLITLMQTKFKL